MLMFFRIERPTTATLRPCSTATSIACCMRWMFDANEATRMRPRAQRDDLPERLADEPLRARHAGALGVRRVAEHQVDAAVAELGEPADVGLEPVDRRVVELPVAGVEDAPGGASRRTTATAVGDRVRHAHELERGTGRARSASPSGSASRSSVDGAEPVLVELRLDQAERQPGRRSPRRPRPRAARTAARRRGPRARG